MTYGIQSELPGTGSDYEVAGGEHPAQTYIGMRVTRVVISGR